MDEKAMKREILIWLGVLFAAFVVGFFSLAYFMAERMYEMSKDREYHIVGKCFKYAFGETLKRLKELSEHAAYDVSQFIEEGRESDIAPLFENFSITGEISHAVVSTGFGKYLFKTFEKVPREIDGKIGQVMKEGKALVEMMNLEGEVVGLAVAPIRRGSRTIGAVAVVRNLDDVTSAAKTEMGGNFEIVSWNEIPEIAGQLLEGKSYVSFRKDGNVMVYYDVYKGKYFIHWTEPDERGTVMGSVFLLVSLLSLPLFGAFAYLITMIRRKIIRNFVEPLKKMVEVLDDLVATTSSSSQELAASSQELAASTKDLEVRGETLSKLASEMLKDMERTQEFSEEVANFSSFLKNSINELEKLGDELSESMKQIHKMGGLIQQIGERIVVLSINASIESSRETMDRQAIRALADEIGNLSETTTERVSEIFASLQAAQEKLDEMSAALRDIMNETEKLDDGARRLLEMVSNNKGEFEKMSDNIQGMFSAIEEVNFASQNLAEAATELSRKSYEVQRVVDEIVMKHSGEEKDEGGDE